MLHQSLKQCSFVGEGKARGGNHPPNRRVYFHYRVRTARGKDTDGEKERLAFIGQTSSADEHERGAVEASARPRRL